MDFNQQTIKSMGFDNYCINYAVNISENGDLIDGYKYEDNNHSVCVTKTDKHHMVLVRAYVQNEGWKTTEVIL